MYSIGREFIRTFSTVYSSSASFLSSSSLMHSAAAAAADGRRQQQRRVRRRPRTIGSTGSAESTAILQPATTARPTHPFGTDTCTRPLQTAPRLLFTLGSSRSTPQSRLTMRQKKKINKGDQSFIEFFHWDIVLLKKKSFGFENDGFSLFHNLLDSITCRVCVCAKTHFEAEIKLVFFSNLFYVSSTTCSSEMFYIHLSYSSDYVFFFCFCCRNLTVFTRSSSLFLHRRSWTAKSFGMILLLKCAGR